jgi:hypothetical protein
VKRLAVHLPDWKDDGVCHAIDGRHLGDIVVLDRIQEEEVVGIPALLARTEQKVLKLWDDAMFQDGRCRAQADEMKALGACMMEEEQILCGMFKNQMEIVFGLDWNVMVNPPSVRGAALCQVPETGAVTDEKPLRHVC